MGCDGEAHGAQVKDAALWLLKLIGWIAGIALAGFGLLLWYDWSPDSLKFIGWICLAYIVAAALLRNVIVEPMLERMRAIERRLERLEAPPHQRRDWQ